MIELTKVEKTIIKFCKGFTVTFPGIDSSKPSPLMNNKMGMQGATWAEKFKPLFVQIYGWGPPEDDDYQDYLNCLFQKLFEIYLKIQNDKSGTNLFLRNIFDAAFRKSISREEDLPIERAISALCGLIQMNEVIENKKYRYKLLDNENDELS